MFDFEYQHIIDYWTKQYNIYMSMSDRKYLINTYEKVMKMYDKDIDFDKMCANMCLKMYLDDKYGGLGVWQRLFLKHNFN